MTSGGWNQAFAPKRPTAAQKRPRYRLGDEGSCHFALLERVRPDAVIHTAYRQDGNGAREIVVDGSANVARAAVHIGARLVHLSTDAVFDGRKGGAYVEEDAPSPCTAYGQMKADAEARVFDVAPGALLVRTSLIVGGPMREPSKHEAGRPLDCSLDATRASSLLRTELRGVRAVFA